MKFTINEGWKADFLSALESINKKLAKYGQAASISKMSAPYTVNKNSRPVVLRDIEIDSPEFIRIGKPVTYLGLKTEIEGVPLIISLDPKYPLKDEHESCDHCNVNRHRTKYFYFLEDGKVKSIGSTCVKDYFGRDIQSLLDRWTGLMTELANAADEDGFGFGGHHSRLTHIYDVITATACATHKFTGIWISKERAGENRPSTSDIIKNYAWAPDSGMRNELSEMWKELDKKAIHEKVLNEYKSTTDTTDFTTNIKNNLFYEDGTPRDYLYSLGVIGWAIYNVMKPQETKEIGKTSEWTGAIGERKVFNNVTVVSVKTLDSMYGISRLVIMKDEDGNVLKTFSSGQFGGDVDIGEIIQIKGTIKAHETYKDVKSTMLTKVILM